MPVLLHDSVIKALEEISSQVTSSQNEVASHIANLKNVIFNEGSLLISEAFERYSQYINKGTLRGSSKKDYITAIKTIFKDLNCSKSVNSLSKQDAIKVRDSMMHRLSATRVVFCFQTFRKFLRWSEAEGLARSGISETFLIQLPTPQKEHTSDIPVELIDKATFCLPNWMCPVFSRYTGFRLGEVAGLKSSSLVDLHGILCFQLGTETKTKEPRLVPVADKLKPYLQYIDKLNNKSHRSDKFNRNIKKIVGLEKCSFHSFRVYANSRMLESAVDQATRMKILGHREHKDQIHIGYSSVKLSELHKAVNTII